MYEDEDEDAKTKKKKKKKKEDDGLIFVVSIDSDAIRPCRILQTNSNNKNVLMHIATKKNPLLVPFLTIIFTYHFRDGRGEKCGFSILISALFEVEIFNFVCEDDDEHDVTCKWT